MSTGINRLGAWCPLLLFCVPREYGDKPQVGVLRGLKLYVFPVSTGINRAKNWLSVYQSCVPREYGDKPVRGSSLT